MTRDQQPVEHQRLDEFHSSGGGVARRIGCSFLVVVILLVGSPFMWSKLKGDYTIKAQMSEGLSLNYRVRAGVDVYIEQHGEFPASNEDAGLPPASEITGNYVSQVGVDDGKIVVIYGKKADRRLVGKTVVFVPDMSNQQDVSWTCSSQDIPDKWLTSTCQSH
jgi:type IV pilus assembly protein PilA